MHNYEKHYKQTTKQRQNQQQTPTNQQVSPFHIFSGVPVSNISGSTSLETTELTLQLNVDDVINHINNIQPYDTRPPHVSQTSLNAPSLQTFSQHDPNRPTSSIQHPIPTVQDTTNARPASTTLSLNNPNETSPTTVTTTPPPHNTNSRKQKHWFVQGPESYLSKTKAFKEEQLRKNQGLVNFVFDKHLDLIKNQVTQRSTPPPPPPSEEPKPQTTPSPVNVEVKEPVDQIVRIGKYTREERDVKIQRLRTNREKRLRGEIPVVVHTTRRELARTRKRHKGRFIKESEDEESPKG
ncbi:pnp [Acrasis kona]|uniref:Pnp n=1 Tax=Acrasis kona TaxID=1008807 RepID=A0AAW2Z988_9EUKA